MAEYEIEISGIDGTIKELNDKLFFKTKQNISGKKFLKSYVIEANTEAEAEVIAIDEAKLEEPSIKSFDSKTLSVKPKGRSL